MANLKIVISALNQASGDLSKVKADIKGVGDAGKDAKGGVTGFADGIGSILGKAALVAGSVAAVGMALKGVYDSAKEAAELDYASSKFDNLSTSIGTVSDALLIDLRAATSGMVSDADLIAGAGDFMALGLAKTHDEVVRLSTVAGALGMNMNQLVLTLTNQTTMRFDALGVSVAGFDEKVKALTESGLSAQDAFTEAFLQQAEEQIIKVGSAADSSKGAFMRFEAASDNLKTALGEGLLPVITPVVEGLTDIINFFANPPSPEFPEFLGDLTQAFQDGIVTEQEYYALQGDVYNGLMTAGDAMQIVAEKSAALSQANADLADSQYDVILSLIDSTANFNEFKRAADEAGVYIGILDEETYNAEKALREAGGAGEAAALGITSAGNAADDASGGMEAVKDATNDAALAMQKYTEALLFKIASEGLSSEAAFSLAEAMGLVDHNTVAATKQVDLYKQMLDAGQITQRQYNQLVEDLADTIDNLPEGKTLEVTTNAEDVLKDLDDIEARRFRKKDLPVVATLDTSAVDNYRPPTRTGTVVYQASHGMNQAVGGAVTGGNPYNWQEYGYRGEVFVPSADGFVLSRADAERALARALYGGESAIDPAAIGKAVAKALSGITGNKQGGGNVYNLTMPTSSNPADVRTAFELMEAWA